MYVLYVSYANEHTRVTSPNINIFGPLKNLRPIIFFAKKSLRSLYFLKKITWPLTVIISKKDSAPLKNF